jgi:hypothetical protein
MSIEEQALTAISNEQATRERLFGVGENRFSVKGISHSASHSF